VAARHPARPPALDRALLIDLDLMHHGAWINMKEALDDAGITLDYRRFYPHIAKADIEGEGRYPFIMIAAGAAPGMAASRMSINEIDESAENEVPGKSAAETLQQKPDDPDPDSDSGEENWKNL